jgi:hypothetical protein
MKSFTPLVALVTALVLGIGTATAADGVRPDDKGGPMGVGAIDEPQVVIPYLSHAQGVDGSQFRVDTSRRNSGWYTGLEHADLPASPPATDVVRPDDRAWRGVGPAPTIELTRTPSVQGDGFDWADAAIGAAAALALGLLAGASALALRRHRVAAVS